MSVPDQLQHVLTSEGCQMHCRPGAQCSTNYTYTANRPGSKPCSKPEQLFSRQESSLLPAIPHSEKQLLSNSESVRSYYSNISKEKHCDPGKFVSLPLSSIYGAVTLLPPLGTRSLLQLLFLFLPHEALNVPTLFLRCIHCQPLFLFHLGIVAIFSSLSL